MDADQLALLRLFRRESRDSMSIREVEKTREGQTPWFKELLRHLKITDKSSVLTPEQIRGLDFSVEPRNTVEKPLESLIRTKVVPFSAADTALGRPTEAFVLHIDLDEAEDVFGVFGDKALMWLHQSSSQQMRDMQKAHGHEHPNAGPGTLTVGWVRYARLQGDVLFVEEIQSDLRTIIGARHVLQQEMQRAQMQARDLHHANEIIHELIKNRLDELDALLDGMEWLCFKRFLAEVHGTSQVVIPSHKFRSSLYKSNPASVYNDIPRKARMRRMQLNEVVEVPGLPDGEVWVARFDVTENTDMMNVIAKLLEEAAHRVEAAGGLYSRLRFIEPQIPKTFLEKMVNICWIQLGRDYPGKYKMEKLWKVINDASDKNADVLGNLEEELSVVVDWGKWVPWIGKQLYQTSKRSSVDEEELNQFLENEFPTLIKYLRKSGADVNKLSLEDVVNKAVETEEAKLPIPPQGEVVYTMPDGWVLQKLETEEQIRAEGVILNHCLNSDVDHYLSMVITGYTELFSLRDPRGFPHVTIEYTRTPGRPGSDKRIDQIQARGNNYPRKYEDRLRNIVMDFFDGDIRGLLLLNALHLANKELAGVDLSGADLTKTDLVGANLVGTNLRDAYLVGVDLTGAKLRGAILIDALMSGAILVDAKLFKANLTSADLKKANLTNADLTKAELSNAYLTNATLTGTKLFGAYLKGADLTGVDLTSVKYDEYTKWPRIFDPKLKKTKVTK